MAGEDSSTGGQAAQIRTLFDGVTVRLLSDHRRSVDDLAGLLRSGERLLALSSAVKAGIDGKPTVGWAVITDSRILYHGISKRQIQSIDCRLVDIDSIEAVAQNGYGKVTATMAGRPFIVGMLDGPDAQAFAERARLEVEAAKTRERLASAPDGLVSQSLAAELSKLADLRVAGVLTDDEFTQAKARLLGS